MDISFNNLITDTLKLIDTTTATFVKQAYSNLGGYINGLLMVSATLYIMWFGYQVLYRKVALDVMTIARYLTLLTIIIMLATNWDHYYRFVYNIFTNEPAVISAALSNGKGSGVEALNNVWLQGCTAASDLFAMADWHNIQYWIYGAAVYTATFFNCLYALGLLVYAKMGLAIILAIGQLFIMLMLWQSTRELTAGWIRGLLYFALIPIVTIAILLLTTSIAQTTLPGLQSNITSGAIKPAGLLPYIALAFLNYFLLKQVLTITSMLSASVSLEALGNAMSMAKNAMRNAKGTAKGTYKGGASAYRGGRALANKISSWRNSAKEKAKSPRTP